MAGGDDVASISTPVLPTNVAFGQGDEAGTLYVTALNLLFSIETRMQGYQPW